MVLRADWLRRILGTLVAAALVIGVLGGSVLSSPSGDTQSIIILNRSPGWQMDPVIQVGSSLRFVEPVYEGLVSYDSKSRTYRPSLATVWDISKDGLQYTFKLRAGVLFHDGTPLTADAVKSSYERVKKINQGIAFLLNSVRAVDVLDASTVRITLNEPNPAFLYATFKIKIISPKAIRDHDVNNDLAQDWLKTNAVGTGPYQLDRYNPQADIVYRRFPRYWKGWQGKHLETVTFKLVVEPATQRQMLERGDADMIVDQVLAQDVPAFKQNPTVQLEIWPAALIMYITLRSDRGPLGDRKLRQALAYAFPYEQVQRSFNGLAAPTLGPLPASLPEYDRTLPQRTQDLTKAKSLLAEAGYPNGGLSFTIVMVQAEASERIAAELFQNALEQLNIKLRIQELVWPVMVAKSRNEAEAADMTFLIMDAGMPAADSLLTQVFHSGSRGKVYNWGWYKNELLDKVVSRARVTVNVDQRLALYRQAQRIIVSDAPAIFVMQPSSIFARRVWVKGFQPDLILPHRLNLEEMSIEGRGR